MTPKARRYLAYARRLSLVFACLGVLVWARNADTGTDRVTVTHPAWIPPLIRRLAVCESRGNPRHHVWNHEGEFGGLVSWAVGTWEMDRFRGMPRRPWNATLRQQVKVAKRSLYRHRTFGCLNHKWVRG